MRATIRTAAMMVALALFLFAGGDAAATSSRFLAQQFPQVGARYAGMGGGHVALPGGVIGGYWNPALLSWSHRFEVNMEGSFTSGPKTTSMNGQNSLRMEDDASFGAVGVLFPGGRGFDYGFVEVSRYEHELKGTLFDSEENRGVSTDQNPNGGKAILEYEDRTTIRSFGMLSSYRTGENHSVGLGLWIDRKKVFKNIDHITDCPPSDLQINNDFLDKEARTNDVSIRLNLGGVWRAGPRLDVGLAVQTASNLKSTLTVDRFSTCVADQSLTAEVSEETPLILQAGGLFRQSGTLRFAGDLIYQKWSEIEDHKDTFQFTLGAEWTATNKLDLRCGVYSVFDPTDLQGGDEEFAERLRDVEWSGNLAERNEIFLTTGFGYAFREYMILDASVEDSHLTSSESGQTSARFSVRLVSDNLKE